jgi:hypothetical protein
MSPAAGETRTPRAPRASPAKWSDADIDRLVGALLDAKGNGLQSEMVSSPLFGLLFHHPLGII